MNEINGQEPKQSNSIITNLPAEIQILIFKYLNSDEIDSTKSVCRSFQHLINNNSIHLTRHKYRAQLDSNEIKIERVSGKSTLETFQLTDNNTELFEYLRHTQLTSLILKGQMEDNVFDSLISILHKTHQYQIDSFIMQSVTIECEQRCGRLFELLASANCQAITLEDCRLACGFTKEQSTRLKDLCQFTVKNTPQNVGILDRYLSKLASDMRFKPRKSLPFYAEAPNLQVGELCQFIKTWIHIHECPPFQIYVNNCYPEFKADFFRACSLNELSHHQLEFRSKTHPFAHIKVIFDDRQRKFQMFPIIDIPPSIDRSFCRTRHFRDY